MTDPIAIRIHTQRPAPERHGLSPQTDENLSVDFSGGAPVVEATRTTYDPTWDGPYAQPTDPSDRRVTFTPVPTSGAVSDAVAGLRSLMSSDRLATLPDTADSATWENTAWPSSRRSYASATLYFADEPRELANLHATRMSDGRWMAHVGGEPGTLLTPQAFTDLLDGAAAVRNAAFASVAA